MPYVIAQPCVDVKDKACVDECPVDCIYEGSRSLYINPNECVDCGACEPVCPTEAIFYEDDLPDEWAWYKDAAVSFFAEVGDLGGASAAGPIGKDPEQAAALPLRISETFRLHLLCRRPSRRVAAFRRMLERVSQRTDVRSSTDGFS